MGLKFIKFKSDTWEIAISKIKELCITIHLVNTLESSQEYTKTFLLEISQDERFPGQEILESEDEWYPVEGRQ